jgi:two-component system response regulator NreC
MAMESIKVLLVHDQTIMRDGFRALLNGHEDIQAIGEATECRETLVKVKELAPDIIIMDMTMCVSELEVIRRLARVRNKGKVLLFIEQDNADQMEFALRAGAAGCLTKGARGEELIEAIYSVYRGESFIHPSLVNRLISDYRSRICGDRSDQLTQRQLEVLRLVAGGYSSREIVEKLKIRLKTVNGHRAKIMAKLNIHNRAELIKYAIRKGIASLD